MKTEKLVTGTTSFIRNEDMLTSEVDSEIVLLSIDGGEYHLLNEVGSYIWNLLKEPQMFTVLINKLLDKYDISQSNCKEDVKVFIFSLLKKGIITIDEKV